MAAKGHSFAERVARWQILADNLKETEGLAHIVPDQEQLDRQLAEARALEAKLEDLRSQFRAVAARMRKLANEGDVQRSRIGANLQGKYGFTSETLIATASSRGACRGGARRRRSPARGRLRRLRRRPRSSPRPTTPRSDVAP